MGALDLTLIRRALNTSSPVGGGYDINRDGGVNALDLAIVRTNLNRTLATTPGPAAVLAPSFSASVVTVPKRLSDESKATNLLRSE